MSHAEIMSVLASLVGMGGVLIWRHHEGRTAVTLRKIVIPPLGMATGFCMFVVPRFRFPPLWAGCAFLVGALVLAWPLLRTSRLTREGDTVMMQRSDAFFLVVIGLALIRILARTYVDRYLTLDQTGGLFFVLAFGMIVRWRLQMLYEYRQITAAQPEPSLSA